MTGYTREKNVSAAERLREQMRRDMLTDLGDDEEDGPGRTVGKPKKVDEDLDGLEWEDMVSPTKRVLSMDVSGSPEIWTRC